MDGYLGVATASRRLVLAYRPELVGDLRSRPLPRLTRYTMTRWGQVARAIEAARDDGPAIENEETLHTVEPGHDLTGVTFPPIWSGYDHDLGVGDLLHRDVKALRLGASVRRSS